MQLLTVCCACCTVPTVPELLGQSQILNSWPLFPHGRGFCLECPRFCLVSTVSSHMLKMTSMEKNSAISQLMGVKFNSGDCCIDLTFEQELLSKWKRPQ